MNKTVILILVLGVSACAHVMPGNSPVTGRPLPQQCENPSVFSAKDRDLIRRGAVDVGMDETAMQCVYGIVERINKSAGPGGTWNQHVINRGFYIYTENGKVISWQKTEETR